MCPCHKPPTSPAPLARHGLRCEAGVGGADLLGQARPAVQHRRPGRGHHRDLRRPARHASARIRSRAFRCANLAGAGDPANLEIDLMRNGTDHRQHVNTRDLITPVPAIVSFASRMMTLLPGDVLFTGAPQGVGPIAAGDVLQTRISRLGEMTLRVRRSW
ncbi:MAG: fumarylacetoacetate hydrolase family protein [Sciscionella sp.]